MDEQRERPLDCQTYFAVQRTSGGEGKQDYFLLSDAEDINDELPFSRNGASWGECNGELACKAYSEPPTLLTFHELTSAGVDSLRDEDGFISDVPSEAVEKVFDDQALTLPSMLTLLEVEIKVDDVLAELETQPMAAESLDELVAAKVEESSPMDTTAATVVSAPILARRMIFASSSPTRLLGSVRVWTICARIAARSPLWRRMSMRKTAV